MEITVHHLERSRSHRVLWLLEELELPYEMKTYERDPKTIRAPRSMRKIHPLGRAPIVELDGDVLVESGAIIETFVERTGKLGPADDERTRYRHLMHYAEGSVMSPLIVKLITDGVRKAPLPFFLKPIAKTIANKIDENFTDAEIDLHFSFLEDHIGERDYFCGDQLTAADIQLSYGVIAGLARGAGERPRLAAWVKRLEARPAYQAALAKGGPVLVK